MSKLAVSIAMSLDGFVAGPDQSVQDPLGVGGMELHAWFHPLREFRAMHGEPGGETDASSAVVSERYERLGATIMGRKMFGGDAGPWGDDPWQGWWGEEPPFHHPVFVVTHHAREPLAMKGGTTFNFVTDGIESALTQARDAARGQNLMLAGGPSVINQYLAAGLVDELDISIVPVVMGGGERLFAGLRPGDLKLTQIRAVEAPGVTHIKYRVGPSNAY